MVYKRIKYMLDNALEDVAEKGELTPNNLEIIEKLICSINGINDLEDREQSSKVSKGYGYDYDDREMLRSMASKRDSMGRYTRDNESEREEVIAEMHELKHRVSDPHTKRKIEKMINELRA